MLQGSGADLEELGGEWDWGACCRISKESIKDYVKNELLVHFD